MRSLFIIILLNITLTQLVYSDGNSTIVDLSKQSENKSENKILNQEVNKEDKKEDENYDYENEDSNDTNNSTYEEYNEADNEAVDPKTLPEKDRVDFKITKDSIKIDESIKDTSLDYPDMDMSHMHMGGMGGMHMDGMSGMDMGGMSMAMSFNMNMPLDYLFKNAKISTDFELFIYTIITALLSFSVEYIKHLRLSVLVFNKQDEYKTKFNTHIKQTILHFIQTTISYLMMLVAMTFNISLFLAVMIGFTAGYFVFRIPPKKAELDCCEKKCSQSSDNYQMGCKVNLAKEHMLLNDGCC